ncbi:MAG: tetratricopeptide repeat protein [Candidatus Acidiferrum sp.]
MTINTKRIAFSCALLVLACLVAACADDPQKAKVKYLASGENYMQKGKYGDAVIQFKNALRFDPQFVNAHYQLAQAQLAQHDWQAAYASLNTVITLDPHRLDARLARGRLYLSARDFHNAELDAEDILHGDRKSVAGHQLLGAAYLGQLKPEQALPLFEQVTQLRPDDASAYVDLALVEISLRDSSDNSNGYSDAAEAHLKKAISLNAKFVPAYTNLSNLYQLNKQPPQAEQVLRQGISNIPNGRLLYLDLAAVLSSQDRSHDGDAIIDNLRKQDPESAETAQAIGDFYLAQKETDRGIAEYRRGLAISANNTAIEKRLEDVYLTTGQAKAAAELDKKLMKDSQDDPVVRINHGRLLTVQGEFSNAILYLQKIVTDGADPEPERARYYLAMAYWQDGDMTQARASLLDALQSARNSPDAKAASNLHTTLVALARLSTTQGNAKDAEVYAKELVDRFPADPDGRQLLWEALARQGEFKSAEVEILKAKELSPNDPNIRVSLAQTYAAEKKWPDAQKEFVAALQLGPHDTVVLGHYSDYLIDRGQLAEAMVLAQEYVDANPNDANGYVLLGALHDKSRDYASAQTEFERAITLDPASNQGYIRLAAVLKERGKTDAAIANYQKALELQPKSAALATMIGNLYLDEGDLGTAQQYYARALEADPNFAIALANTAWVYAQEDKNLDLALGMAQKAKSLMPEVASITDTLGWVMYKRGSYESAVPLLEECVQKAQDSAKFRLHLGLTLLMAGQKAKAKQQLQAALRMNLDAIDAQQAHQALTEIN